MSGLLRGILNFRAPMARMASLALLLFWDGSPYWRNNLPLGFEQVANKRGKCSRAKLAKLFDRSTFRGIAHIGQFLSHMLLWQKMCHFSPCALMTSLSSVFVLQTLVRSSPGHCFWGTRLSSRIKLMGKTNPIQEERNVLLPKLWTLFTLDLINPADSIPLHTNMM